MKVFVKGLLQASGGGGKGWLVSPTTTLQWRYEGCLPRRNAKDACVYLRSVPLYAAPIVHDDSHTGGWAERV